MSENQNDFEALRRILALKRHEVPPPGYFEGFSGGVIARIHAAETTRHLPWLLRLLQAFEARPAYPVAMASSLCLLLLFGIVTVEQNPGISPAFAETGVGATANPIAYAEADSGSPASLASLVGNTNPPINLSGNSSLFDSGPNPFVHQVSFSPAGN